ncbi:glycosyltransferase family 8 protein [Lophiostoma macrostomum CBS 122681]|uniref:Glycosyltransferase family 8 protein n=1 Tax=Lophiostoma macrostomum CBS 122681 TaxID=1314788 RepID=A0A6A6T8X9_9PLEO|nr:glycosyltransferase family 8 protein [Lophiostoma macrostomum CBS 122681]
MILRSKVSFALALALSFLLITWCWHSSPSASSKPPYRLFESSSPLPSTQYAIATFLTGQATNDDSYFVATRVLTHQLLHAPATRCNSSSTSFLVLCSQDVSTEQKEILRKDGATVVEVQDVPLNWWIYSGVQRWKEQFTKLRVFEMTEYKRILFIDADTLITGHLGDIFDEPEVNTLAPTLSSRKEQMRKDESPFPTQWLFAARSDNQFTGEREHSTPPLQTPSFSAGFFLVAPDKEMYQHLLAVMSHFHRFDPFTMEQSLLNYVFRREGAMPWRELHWKWSATWPNEKDLDMGVASLHEKLWNTGPQRLQNIWKNRKDEMIRFQEERRVNAVT